MPSLFYSLAHCLLLLEANAFQLSTRTVAIPRHLNARDSQSLTTDGFAYTTNITMGGQQYEVVIDTGSSDLWLATSEEISGTIGTEYDTSLTYADGRTAGGPIRIGEIDNFMGFHIPAQAYIAVDPQSEIATSLPGLVGLGFSSNSRILQTLPPSYVGVPVLDSIFMSDTSTPNHLSFYLGRTGDPTDPSHGEITVGTIIDDYPEIQEQPKVPAIRYLDELGAPDYGHFAIYVDGFKGPDGSMFHLQTMQSDKYTSKLEVPPKDGQLISMVDTGFTLSQIPHALGDAIYSDFGHKIPIPGSTEHWIVPCDSEINWSIIIGGQEYPIHPMDTVLDHEVSLGAFPDYFAMREDLCVGAFQPITPDVFPIDMILGMSFIRNAYTLVNFGNFVSDNLTERGEPFLQFYSITDLDEAHNDFVSTRLGGVDTSGMSINTNKNSSSKVSNAVKKISTVAIGIIVATIVITLLVFGLIIFCICRKRNKKKALSMKPRYQKVAGGEDISDNSAPQDSKPAMQYDGVPSVTSPYRDPWGPK